MVSDVDVFGTSVVLIVFGEGDSGLVVGEDGCSGEDRLEYLRD